MALISYTQLAFILGHFALKICLISDKNLNFLYFLKFEFDFSPQKGSKMVNCVRAKREHTILYALLKEGKFIRNKMKKPTKKCRKLNFTSHT